MNAIAYASRLFYEPSRIHAAAVYCSDGRMGDHFDDFLQNGLRLPRYDRVALPGGPAMLLDHGCSRSAVTHDALSFLVEAHGLERVLLIAHEGCAFYAQRLGIPDEHMEACQCRDLRQAAARVRETAPHLLIDTYFARVSGNRIIVEQLETHRPAEMIRG